MDIPARGNRFGNWWILKRDSYQGTAFSALPKEKRQRQAFSRCGWTVKPEWLKPFRVVA